MRELTDKEKVIIAAYTALRGQEFTNGEEGQLEKDGRTWLILRDQSGDYRISPAQKSK